MGMRTKTWTLTGPGRERKNVVQEAGNERVEAISQMWFGDKSNLNTGILQQRNALSALSMGEKRWWEGARDHLDRLLQRIFQLSIEEKKMQ